MLMILTSPHLKSAVGVAKVAGATESASSFFSSWPKETATSERATAAKNKTFILEKNLEFYFLELCEVSDRARDIPSLPPSVLQPLGSESVVGIKNFVSN